MSSYHGRLELTWTNKDMRLLAHEDNSYEWVPPADYRVAEVRLLHDVSTVGDVADGKARSRDNLLIRGDALNALTSLIELPEFAAEYLGKVKLVYIDPPFNTGEIFAQFEDNLEHSVWLTLMRDRLGQIAKLLSPDGSVWVHLNDDEGPYAKAVMDELFTRANFIATFVWQKVDSPNDNKVPITNDHDYILCYSKNPGATNFPQKPDRSVAGAYHSRDEETGKFYRDRLLKKNGKNSLRKDRPTMWFEIPGPDGVPVLPIHDDGREARWSYGTTTVTGWLVEDEDRTDQGLGNIVWKERPGHFERVRPEPAEGAPDDAKPRWRLHREGTHWVPYTREWEPEVPTRPWPTIWAASAASTSQELAVAAMRDPEFTALTPDGLIARALQEIAQINVLGDVKTTRQAKGHLSKLFPGVTPFSTPKPEELMARIIAIATSEGDIVLDCYAGSGSTLTTAHKLGRRWVGIERSRNTLETFTIPRLQKVVSGDDIWGISESAAWEGGGGFRLLEVAPSMFHAESGQVFLSEWATNTRLAEVTAAQLHYAYDYDPPFAGRRGRSRLAVVDGLVNDDVVRLLVPALAQDERLVICGTAIDPAAKETLRTLRRGSTLRKIPQAILHEYREIRQPALMVLDTPRPADGRESSVP